MSSNKRSSINFARLFSHVKDPGDSLAICCEQPGRMLIEGTSPLSIEGEEPVLMEEGTTTYTHKGKFPAAKESVLRSQAMGAALKQANVLALEGATLSVSHVGTPSDWVISLDWLDPNVD